jgi:hypothetical protein
MTPIWLLLAPRRPGAYDVADLRQTGQRTACHRLNVAAIGCRGFMPCWWRVAAKMRPGRSRRREWRRPNDPA